MALLQLVTNIEGELDTSFFRITSLSQLGSKGLEAALVIGPILALGYLIWGVIDWIMSEGEKQQLGEARKKITHAVIGLALLASVWILWSLARYFLGFGVGGNGGSAGGGGRGDVACNAEQIAIFDRAECIRLCQANKGCTGANCVTDKNEYGETFCECAPGSGQSWADAWYSECVPPDYL
ncbi:pilin [Patescibacteria group bacterium]|nr:pilin [Patescibacteria group bacterium]MBU1931497.1 pilin [Patescibacteria group bacterium]